MRALTWRGDVSKGEDYAVEEIPAEMAEQAAEYREELLEAVAEKDDALMERYLAGEELTVEEIKHGIRAVTVTGEAYPVICGSAFKNKGVQPMLDAVIDYLPAPTDVPPVEGTLLDGETPIQRSPNTDEPFAALAFKIAAHPFFGKLTYVRVYSGKASQGTQVINSTKDRKERIGKFLQMHSNKENPVDDATAGHIYAVVGLKDTTTGDTLCDPQNPIILESMTFPEPVISVAIEPKTKADQEKLSTAIQRLAEEDPTFRVNLDEETGQTIISGMGELHLEVLVNRMKSRLQGRGQHRQAAGGLPRDDPQDGRQVRVHAQEADRWFRPVRQGHHQARAAREDGRRSALRVRQQGHRRSRPAGVHPVGGRRAPRTRCSTASSPATRWSGSS